MEMLLNIQEVELKIQLSVGLKKEQENLQLF